MTKSDKVIVFGALSILFIAYSVFVYSSANIKNVGSLSAEAQKGKLVFQKYNCGACHQVYGLGGYMGPDLTNVLNSEGKGKEYAKAFIVYGTVKMPNFKLPQEEVNSLLAFLEDVSKTGNAFPENPHMDLIGAMNQENEK